jgi:hypothetical protein
MFSPAVFCRAFLSTQLKVNKKERKSFPSFLSGFEGKMMVDILNGDGGGG